MAVKRKRGGSSRLSRFAFAALVILGAAAIIFFLLMRGGGSITVAENTVGTVLTPLQSAFTNATNWAINLVENRRSLNELQAQYDEARREIDSLKIELNALNEEALENDRYEALLDAQDRYETLEPMYAKVIGHDPGVWFDTFSINRGTSDGVTANMAVITGDGLVGHVYEAGLNYAKVRSVIDPRSAVACLIERTRDDGVMRGVTTEEQIAASCNMYYLLSVNDIIPGDTVITSGVDSLYPKGIPVGTVTAISRKSESSETYVVITPHVDFDCIEEVLVLRSIVEKDTDTLPSLPTPTPRPTLPPVVTQAPTASPDKTPSPETDIWSYPSPTPVPRPNDMKSVEDEWANE